MRNLLLTLILIFTGTGLAQASDGYDNITRAAHRMENAAEHFYKQLKYDAGYRHLTRDAKQFARAARHFHRQVERGGSYGHIRGDYAKLVNEFNHVQNVFAASHDLHHQRHLRGDFRKVTRAYRNLNRAIQYEQSRYSRYRRNDHYDRGYDDDYGYGRRYDRHNSGLTISFRGRFGF